MLRPLIGDYIKAINEVELQDSAMSFSVDMFPLIFFCLIGLPSLHGESGHNHESLRAIDFRQTSTIFVGKIMITKISGQEMRFEDHFGTRLQKRKGFKLKHQLQTNLLRTRGLEREHQLQTKDTERNQITNEVIPGQETNVKPQLLITGDEQKKEESAVGYQEIVQKSPPKTFGDQIQIANKANRRLKFENAVNSLWKRGQGHSVQAHKSEDDRQRPDKSHPHSNTTSKIKKILHPISIFSKTKRKDESPRSPKRSSKNLQRGNSVRSGLDKGLTSGYSAKPSGAGRVSTKYPAEGLPVPNSQPPQEDSGTLMRGGSYTSWGTYRRDEIGESGRLSVPTPSRSYEKQKMWDYIHRVSKKMTEGVNASKHEESLVSEQTQTSNDSLPQSRGHTTPREYRDKERADPLSTSKSPSLKKFQPPVVESHSPSQSDKEDQDKNIIEYIVRCKKVWKDSAGLPDSPPPERPSSPMRSPPRSPTKQTAPPPKTTTRNPREELREFTTMEMNDHYAVLTNRVKSTDQVGKKSG